MLPDSPVTITKTIPSYLYFEYQTDPDLPSLIESYNAITQNYVDWFNNANLPIYTGLSGKLLDWVGIGLYGLPRPGLSNLQVLGVIGQLASAKYHGPTGPASPIPNIVNALATTQAYETVNNYDTPDDIYKRILTWAFYKGDGFVFSVPWLKRRIARFLYAENGGDISAPFTPDISVSFDDTTTPRVTCNISITEAGNPLAEYLQAAINNGILSLPFRFTYSVTLT